jgi:predicted nucleic acid-binding Zn ribbon protein
MRGTEEHRHCKVCGRVTDPSEETCSAKCTEELGRRRSSRQSSMNLMYLLIAVVVVLFLLSFVHL